MGVLLSNSTDPPAAAQGNDCDDCFVMLLHTSEGYPFVLISDAPDALTTLGAQQARTFQMTEDRTWPDQARAYAQELSRANGNATIEYEAWRFPGFDDEDDGEDSD